jgi:hypothetical protein
MFVGKLILYKSAYYMQSFVLRENINIIKITPILRIGEKAVLKRIQKKIYINRSPNHNQ